LQLPGADRDYTPLAQRLAPDSGRGLVRRPRQEDLINDALIPAMWESRSDNDRMLSLLRQALLWLVGARQKSRQRIEIDKLLVPVSGHGDAWEWAEPRTAYLGQGWDADPIIALLTRAYGDRPNKQLVAWERFEKKAIQRFKDVDRQWWFERMKEIGVASCPRIVCTPRAVGVAESRSKSQLTPNKSLPCPVPCPTAVWKSYLTQDAWVIPNRFQHAHNELVAALRGLLGQDRVVRVSESPIDVQFTPLEGAVPVLEYLAHAYPGYSVAEDLGLLILKGGSQATSPQDRAFGRAWQRVTRSRIVRGRFEGASPVSACFDAQHPDGQALLVDSSLQPHFARV
jgi:hypothetical protein